MDDQLKAFIDDLLDKARANGPKEFAALTPQQQQQKEQQKEESYKKITTPAVPKKLKSPRDKSPPKKS